MKRAILLIVCGLIALSGCKSYYLNKYCKPVINRIDSTVFVVKLKDSVAIKDSVVIKPATQTLIYLPSPCDSNGRLKPGFYSSAQGNNKTQLIITDTGITVQSNCEESISSWQNLYRLSQDSIATLRKLNDKIVIEKQLNRFENFIIKTPYFWWIGLFGVVSLFLWVCLKFYKH